MSSSKIECRARHCEHGRAGEVLGDVLERLGVAPLCESEWRLYERSARQPRRPIPAGDLAQWLDGFLAERAEAVR